MLIDIGQAAEPRPAAEAAVMRRLLKMTPDISLAELCVFCFALGAMMVVDVIAVAAVFGLWREIERGGQDETG